MFRYDEMGRVTRHKDRHGQVTVTPNGFFETLVKNGDDSYTLTTKEKTVYRFQIGSQHAVSGGWPHVAVGQDYGCAITIRRR